VQEQDHPELQYQKRNDPLLNLTDCTVFEYGVDLIDFLLYYPLLNLLWFFLWLHTAHPHKIYSSDVLILRFLEAYCENLANYDALVEVWPYCLAYSKDVTSQAYGYKYLFPSLLRFIHSVVDKLSTTSCFEDRKIRKEMQVCHTLMRMLVTSNEA
jgi:hypothetical protein